MTTTYVTRELPCPRCDEDGKTWTRQGWAEYPEGCQLCMGTRKIFKRVAVEVPHDWTPEEEV